MCNYLKLSAFQCFRETVTWHGVACVQCVFVVIWVGIRVHTSEEWQVECMHWGLDKQTVRLHHVGKDLPNFVRR